MGEREIAVLVVFGPLALMWIAVGIRSCYNILVHNDIWGKR